MKKSALLILGFAVLALTHSAPSAQEQAGFKVIAHPDNPVTSLSKAQVSKFLLKKASKWDHGERVLPVDLGGQGPVREAFSKAIHGRNVTSIQRYWQRQIFAGDGVPPPELGSDREVVDYVSKNPGAIGYVSENAVATGVKVIEVTE
jgi:ABC-type phosphate transport system substrate-binding protein